MPSLLQTFDRESGTAVCCQVLLNVIPSQVEANVPWAVTSPGAWNETLYWKLHFQVEIILEKYHYQGTFPLPIRKF